MQKNASFCFVKQTFQLSEEAFQAELQTKISKNIPNDSIKF